MWKAAAAHKTLLVIMTVALVLRLAYGLSRPADAGWLASLPDQAEYHAIATSLLQGEGLAFTDPRFGQQVLAFRAPGYPLFLAALGADVFWVRIAQALLDTSTVLAVYLLVSRLMPSSRYGPMIAGGLVAVHPLLVQFSSFLLTETLTTALLAWGVYLLSTRSRLATLVAALLLAAAAMTRPSFWPIALLLVGGRILTLPISWRQRLGVSAAAALTMLALALPWATRNALALGHPIFTTTNAGITAYDGFNPDADGSSNQHVFLQDMPYLSRMSELDRDAYLGSQAAAYVREYPSHLPRLTATKLARTFTPVPLAAENRTVLYWAVGLGFLLPLLLAAAAGVVRSAIAPRHRLLLLVPVAVVALTHALSVGSMRYRIPVEPMLCVLAAGWLVAPRRGPAAAPLNPAA
jgi:hypothetical protein